MNDFLLVLQSVIDRQSRAAVINHAELLANLFMRMFDLRYVQCSHRTEDSYEDNEIDEAESAVNAALITIIYKLNDSTFRPIFVRYSEWAHGTPTTRNSSVHRQITWWTFQLQFFSTLKSLVTGFAGLTVGYAVDILNEANFEDSSYRHLWQRVINTLQSALEHDQDSLFKNPAHFTPLRDALVSQMRKCAFGANADLLPQLISAVTALAAATDSSSQHKSLCSPLLHSMRDDSASVRLAAVKCLLSLTERLGEEWLSQLPEMLPFISEGMEDDDESVELEVRNWIRQIEGILGESVGPMLH